MFGLVIGAFCLAFLSALVGVLRAGPKRGRRTGSAARRLSKTDSQRALHAHALGRIEIWTDGGDVSDALVDELRTSLLARLEIDYRGRLFVLDWVRERDRLWAADAKLAIFLIGSDGSLDEWEAISPNSSTGSSHELLGREPGTLTSSAFIIVNCRVPPNRVEQLKDALQAAGLWEAHPVLTAHTLDLSFLYHTISKFVINDL